MRRQSQWRQEGIAEKTQIIVFLKQKALLKRLREPQKQNAFAWKNCLWFPKNV